MNELEFDYGGGCVDEKEFLKHTHELEEYREHLRGVVQHGNFLAPEASLCLPTDAISHKKIEDTVAMFASSVLKYVVVVIAILIMVFGVYTEPVQESADELVAYSYIEGGNL